MCIGIRHVVYPEFADWLVLNNCKSVGQQHSPGDCAKVECIACFDLKEYWFIVSKR